MKKIDKKTAMALAINIILILISMFASSDVWAKDFAKQIQGSWTLVSCINEKDGQKFDVYGENPRGLMILTPGGDISVMLMRATLPKFAANDRRKGTTEENQAVIEGITTYFGKYKVVDEKKGMVEITIKGSSFPNWDGTVQKRTLTVKGDELKQVNPSPAIGSGVNYLLWKREK